MKAQIDALIARWGALSARERAGAAVLLALFMVGAASGAADWMFNAQEKARQAREAQVRIEAVSGLQQDEAWRGRVAEAAGRVWAWSVVEPTESIARARAMAELEALVQGAGVSDASVTAVEAEEGAEGAPLGPLDFVIEGDFDWAAVSALLTNFEQSPLSVSTTAMDVRGSADGAPRFSMTVRLSFVDEDFGA
ncbi:hypothetical protein U91I_01934 [alpha proteobacterium U9-1i]|nr:hypothetical protein U91I_01934 [alpha proteobacterium U9-1i]